MTRYETPEEVRPLEKLILGFSSECGRSPMTVFEDFLAYVIHGFSPGVPPLKSWKYKGLRIDKRTKRTRAVLHSSAGMRPYGGLYGK